MKVITCVVNNPIFIEIQYNTLKKYMKCDYELIVFNDAKQFPDFTNGGNILLFQEICNICNKLGIKYINIPNDHHTQCDCPVTRTSDSMNFIYRYQLLNKDKYLLIDSDMFLYTDFYGNEYDDYSCAIVLQNRKPNINYMWNGLYYFDMNKMNYLEYIAWDKGDILVNGNRIFTDVGGRTKHWINRNIKNIPKTESLRFDQDKNKKFVENNVYFIRHLWSCSWNMEEMPENVKDTNLIQFIRNDPRNISNKFYCEIYDNKFLHYRGGGDWERRGINCHIYLANELKKILL